MVENKFVQVFLKEYSKSITKDFKKYLDDDLYVDLVFICDNKKRVKAHQIVLAYLSQFLYKMLIENQYDSSRKVVYICVPDVSFNVMERIVQFLYTGQIYLDAQYLKEFNEVMQLLGMPSCTFLHTNQVVPPALADAEKETNHKDENNHSRPFCQNGKNCVIALAIGKDTRCKKGSVTLPRITEVRSLSKTASKILPVSPVSAAERFLNDEEESIRKIAESLFFQLKKISSSSRKVKNSKIHKRNNLNKRLAKNEDLQDRLSPKKNFRHKRWCSRFVDGQMELNSSA